MRTQISSVEAQRRRELAALPVLDLSRRAFSRFGLRAVTGLTRGALISTLARDRLPPRGAEGGDPAASSVSFIDELFAAVCKYAGPRDATEPAAAAAAEAQPPAAAAAAMDGLARARLELLCLSRKELRERIFTLGLDGAVDVSMGSKASFVDCLARAAAAAAQATGDGPEAAPAAAALHPSLARLRELLASMEGKVLQHRLLALESYKLIGGERKGELIKKALALAVSRTGELALAFPEWVVAVPGEPPLPESVAAAFPEAAAPPPPRTAAPAELAEAEDASQPGGAASAPPPPPPAPPHEAAALSALLCQALVWSYDCAAAEVGLVGGGRGGGLPNTPAARPLALPQSSSARLLSAGTYQGAFVRNVLSATNDFHGIADAPNIVKVPVMLGGFIPLVMFVTARNTRQHEEALMEYGHEWSKTFCR